MNNLFSIPQIYYDIKLGKFRSYKTPCEAGHVLSSPAEYYADSQWEQRPVEQISQTYFDRYLVEVGNVDEFEFAEQTETGGWRAVPINA